MQRQRLVVNKAERGLKVMHQQVANKEALPTKVANRVALSTKEANQRLQLTKEVDKARQVVNRPELELALTNKVLQQGPKERRGHNAAQQLDKQKANRPHPPIEDPREVQQVVRRVANRSNNKLQLTPDNNQANRVETGNNRMLQKEHHLDEEQVLFPNSKHYGSQMMVIL